jgi:hypothetical protein
MRRFAIIFLPLFVALLLPVWTVWYIGPWEGTGEPAMIWSVIRMIPYNVREVGIPGVFEWHSGNLIECAILLFVGIGVDQFLVRKKRRSARGFSITIPSKRRSEPETVSPQEAVSPSEPD